MDKLCVFTLIFAILANEALCMYRQKRQSSDDEENTLDDRYGWDRQRRPQGQWQRPNQGWQRPNQEQQQNQGWQRPNQEQQTNQGWQQPNQGWQQPNQGWQQPNQPNQGGQVQPTPQPSGNGATTESPAVATCVRNCAVTPEYNPVCGSNGVTYTNPGRLTCAQNCGVNVNLQRQSPCPTTTTARPNQ